MGDLVPLGECRWKSCHTPGKFCRNCHPHRCVVTVLVTTEKSARQCRNLGVPVDGAPIRCYLHGGPRYRRVLVPGKVSKDGDQP